MGGKRNKSQSFSAKRLGLETDEITIERAHWVRKKEGGEERTIIAKCLYYKQREKLLNKCKEQKLWEDQIYIHEDFSECTVERRKILFKRAKVIRERGKFTKVVYNRLVLY